jgi:hypothetical protein
MFVPAARLAKNSALNFRIDLISKRFVALNVACAVSKFRRKNKLH